MTFRTKLLVALFVFLGASVCMGYENELRKSGNRYFWKAGDDQRGNSTDLATAIEGVIGEGGRTVHILTGGTLTRTVKLKPGTTLRCHGNTFNRTHKGDGFHLNQQNASLVRFHDMTLTGGGGVGIRTSQVSDVHLLKVTIRGADIGVRIDSHPSRPYADWAWISKLTVKDCTFEDCKSHGLETYGIKDVEIDGFTARNCGGCGLLLNKTLNVKIGTIDAFKSPTTGGYAGFRCANGCANITVEKVTAKQCNRGIFLLTGSRDITIKDCEIIDCPDIGIWLENVKNCKVLSGTCNTEFHASGEGSVIHVNR